MKKIGRIPLLVIIIGSFVLVVGGFSYWGSGTQSSSAQNSTALDRRAPQQQRQFARIIDGYYDREKQLMREGEAVRGNPIKGATINAEETASEKKLFDDLFAVVNETGGRFENWVGTVEMEIQPNFSTEGGRSVRIADLVRVTFHPDGMAERGIFLDQPTSYHPWALFQFVTEDSVNSAFGQALGLVDVKKKVKASGTLVTRLSVPQPRYFLQMRDGNPTPFVGSGGSGSPFKLPAKFSSISNL